MAKRVRLGRSSSDGLRRAFAHGGSREEARRSRSGELRLRGARLPHQKEPCQNQGRAVLGWWARIVHPTGQPQECERCVRWTRGME